MHYEESAKLFRLSLQSGIKTGGPFTIFDVQGEACMVGGDMEKQDHPGGFATKWPGHLFDPYHIRQREELFPDCAGFLRAQCFFKNIPEMFSNG